MSIQFIWHSDHPILGLKLGLVEKFKSKILSGYAQPLIDESPNAKNTFLQEILESLDAGEKKGFKLIVISVQEFIVKNIPFVCLPDHSRISSRWRHVYKIFDQQIQQNFCLTCSDIVLINQNGEIDRHLEDLLSISALAVKSLFFSNSKK